MLIHPALWDSRIWDDQFDEFTRHHDVVRYDLRGSGRSDRPTAPYSGVRDLRDLLGDLEIGRCAIVGCATGAQLAVDFALARPDVVDAIVPVAPGLTGYEWNDAGLVVLTEEMQAAVRAGELERAMDMQLAVWSPPGEHPDSDERVRAIAMANLRSLQTDEGLLETPPAAVELLGDLGAAMLVIIGDRDLGERHAIADLLVTRVPGARKRVIADADQLVNVRKPAKFNRLVLDFLSFRM